MDKREFIRSAGATAILASLGFTISNCSSEKLPEPGGDTSSDFQFDLNNHPYNSLNTEGEWILVKSESLLLVNAEGTIMAFSSVCTHLGCSSAWTFGENAVCGCHGSTFDQNGNVVQGPAKQSLIRKSVTINGDIVVVA
ncbi:ubiquinol-cytochrome c reductase iron-sulfur subunit [Marinoscillum sp. MHG1-6]|uniref:QcrA and Rieske domain-containing protein n=1 Tax=Marinoscillum sp. MHG1-6 TaxID=2959627 RepID=UPI0021571DD3|nr:Rieske (2Fe-2S) protein [Marinoscillum sp. MHG1-6]